ncbi:hypothetical protein GUJ93_ZPchr0002g25247 [Zizania palustris]|uniref:Uncharacterized protein n=1 Tax=Zizania palustris TaxID=103762 RepID=A0A8J5S2I7_ZIZPA|nr:hypothetical protein GUJ93_ZPchr0002g25247 [Zizania palustris]
MASRGHNGALWAKLYELERQLRLMRMRAARGEVEEEGDVTARAGGSWWNVAAEGTRRGRQYDAYMRRRDARRTLGGVAAAAEEEGQLTRRREARAAVAGRPSPLALNCTDVARNAQEVKRSPAVFIPTTPRKENGGLPRTRTVNTGASSASGGTAKSSHQRRSSLGVVPSDFGESVTPRPFLRRGSGTGGATTLLRAPPPRVHDLPLSDVAIGSPRQQPPPLAARRHSRSVSELPFHHAVELESPRSAVEVPPPQAARARKRWGSPETPRAMLSAAAAADSHKDFTKGLKKLLSFMKKSSSSSKSIDQHCPASPPAGNSATTGWSTAATATAPVTG